MANSPPTSRVVRVLDALADAGGALSASDLARQLDLSTSTLSLILATLRDMHYVDRLPDRSYQLGSGVMRLLHGLQARFPLLGVANEELSRLAGLFGCGCTLARVDADSQEVILTAGATAAAGIQPGVRLPLDPPHGAIAMAWRPADEIARWLQGAGAADAQRQALAYVRQLGYAVYGIRRNADAMIEQLRELLGAVQRADSMDALHRQLDELARAVGSRIYSPEELASGNSLDVSLVIAPAFGADARPRYLVSLQLMRDAVPVAELESRIAAVMHSARTLTQQIGGIAPG